MSCIGTFLITVRVTAAGAGAGCSGAGGSGTGRSGVVMVTLTVVGDRVGEYSTTLRFEITEILSTVVDET